MTNSTVVDEEKKKYYGSPVVLRGILSKGRVAEDTPEPVLCYEYCIFFGSEECSIKRLKKAQQNGFCKEQFKLKIPTEGIDAFEALLIKNLRECA